VFDSERRPSKRAPRYRIARAAPACPALPMRGLDRRYALPLDEAGVRVDGAGAQGLEERSPRHVAPGHLRVDGAYVGLDAVAFPSSKQNEPVGHTDFAQPRGCPRRGRRRIASAGGPGVVPPTPKSQARAAHLPAEGRASRQPRGNAGHPRHPRTSPAGHSIVLTARSRDERRTLRTLRAVRAPGALAGQGRDETPLTRALL
jgi:hypothetical protein